LAAAFAVLSAALPAPWPAPLATIPTEFTAWETSLDVVLSLHAVMPSTSANTVAMTAGFLRTCVSSGSIASLTAKGFRPVRVGSDLRATPFRQLDPMFCQPLTVTFAGDAKGYGGYEPEPCLRNPLPAIFTHPIGSIEKLLKSVVDIQKLHRAKFPEARLYIVRRKLGGRVHCVRPVKHIAQPLLLHIPQPAEQSSFTRK
jgi:hypothetical protein